MTKIKAKDIFKLKNLDKKWKWIAKDRDNRIYIYALKPKNEYKLWNNVSYFIEITNTFQEEIDFGTDDWTKCCVERPVDYSQYIGKLGIFSDRKDSLKLECVEMDMVHLSILENIDDKKMFWPRAYRDYCFRYFRPLTKEEIKQLTNYGEEDENN